ncbi:MAG: tetratricopeptide repeat protein [Treponema sp.]|nr:tetratricopeptide repeat protein [Treponema sp.]
MKRVTKLAWIVIAVVTASCSDNNDLYYMERLMETNPAQADTLFRTFPVPEGKSQRAWYAVLKTQTDYKCYKPVISDSLILTATDYYGTPYNAPRKRRYRAAMAWYTLGCVYYNSLDDVNAIDALLKAQVLFPDTLIRYYALLEQNLGTCYLNQRRYDEAIDVYQRCLNNVTRINDQNVITNVTFYLGLCQLYSGNYVVAESIFNDLVSNPRTSGIRLRESYINLSKIYIYGHKDYEKAMYFIDRYLSITEESSYSGAGFNIKADIYYLTEKYDSAYMYYSRSLDCMYEMHTVCDNYNKLAKLSVIFGKTDDALYYMDKYEALSDSISRLKDDAVVNESIKNNNEELFKQQIVNKSRLMVIVSVSLFLILVLLFVILHDRRINARIKDKQDEILSLKTRLNRQEKDLDDKYNQILHSQKELQNLHDEIREYSVNVLSTRLNDSYSGENLSHDKVFSLYKQKINSSFYNFRVSESHGILVSAEKDGVFTSFSAEEKKCIYGQLSDCFLETIQGLSLEYPSVSPKDIYVLLLSGMGMSNRIIADLFFVSESAIRKKKERLKEKLGMDLYALLDGDYAG